MRKVIVDGTEFETISEAARHYKISNPTVIKRCSNPNFPDWILQGNGKKHKMEKELPTSKLEIWTKKEQGWVRIL